MVEGKQLLRSKPEGFWCIQDPVTGKSGTMFPVYSKPGWIRKKIVKILLGWEWVSNQ